MEAWPGPIAAGLQRVASVGRKRFWAKSMTVSSPRRQVERWMPSSITDANWGLFHSQTFVFGRSKTWLCLEPCLIAALTPLRTVSKSK